MEKEINRVSFALILSIILLCPILLGAAPSHTDLFYVNDYANVLSDETESQILSTAVDLEKQTGAQVVILTVNSLDGEDISDYAVETFRNWGIGDEESDNGVLILLSVGDREMWVTTGYGLEGTLTDTSLGQMRDAYAIPYYRNDDFETGTILLFNAIVNEIRTEEYGLEPLDFEQPENYPTIEPTELPNEVLLVLTAFWATPFCIVIGGGFFRFIKYMRLRAFDKKNGTKTAEECRKKCKEKRANRHHPGGHDGYGGHGGFGGGGFGGGGFGGGGGFSGGGGSTGGGGAGGRF